MNDHQKNRFAKNIVKTLFNTVADKKITFLGWAFKKDTNDSRESPAISVAASLILERANIHIFDPKVGKDQVIADLSYFMNVEKETLVNKVSVHNNPIDAVDKAHALAILTEWDEFASYDWKEIYSKMLLPAFVFDGRNILDEEELKKIGFQTYFVGRS